MDCSRHVEPPPLESSGPRAPHILALKAWDQPKQLDVHVERGPEQAWIRLEGELDISSVPDLEQAISRVESAGPRLLGIDLRHLSFLDSTGLRVLIDAHTRVSGANRRLVLIRGPSRVQRVFQITGMDNILKFVDPPHLCRSQLRPEQAG
jgi:anti-sigma B factor antagonist